MNAQKFWDAFFAAYNEARAKYDNPTWKEVWGINGSSRWSHHMLWEPESVIRTTAKALGLSVARGEPLRLDAVFTLPEPPDSWHHFPIQVALEHENVPWTMEKEIRALLSVRAPLKVGITYSLSDHRRSSRDVVKWLAERINEEYRRSLAVTKEDPKTEYLFIVGEEHETIDFALNWKIMSFNAEEGPTPSFRSISAE